jgi:hypothetical protein
MYVSDTGPKLLDIEAYGGLGLDISVPLKLKQLYVCTDGYDASQNVPYKCSACGSAEDDTSKLL